MINYWINSIRNEIGSIKKTPVDFKKFGLSFGSILIIYVVIADWKQWWGIDVLFSISVIGVFFIVVGLIKSRFLKVFYYYWMCVAIIIGVSFSWILLIFIYYFLISPMAIIARLFDIEFLPGLTKKNMNTYWKKRDQNIKNNFEKMF